MNRWYKANTRLGVYLAVPGCFMSAREITKASPSAFMRNDVSIYMKSDAVVEAVVTISRRWSEGIATLHLVAKYKVVDIFKERLIKMKS